MKVLSLMVFALAAYGNEKPWDLDFFHPYSIHMDDNRDQIEVYEGTPIYDVTRPIVGMFSNKMGSYFCTGSLVGENIIMTNAHCKIPCEDAEAHFYYEGQSSPNLFKTRCTAEIADNVEFDYWFFYIDRSPREVEPTYLAYQRIQEGQELLIAGHPQGRPKMIDLSNTCRVKHANVGEHPNGRLANFGHQCDTEGGNSGSPVFDRKTGAVIGLHYYGGARTVDPDSFNMAVPTWAILQDLYTKAPDALRYINYKIVD